MHTFQLAAEDYGVQHDGTYSDDDTKVAALLPAAGANFKNPFAQAGTAHEDRGSMLNDPSATSGVTSYADSSTTNYNIKGVGKATSGAAFPLSLVLSAGQ
jgi:hypothetical protein